MALKKYGQELTNKLAKALKDELVKNGGFDKDTVEYVLNHYDLESMFVSSMITNIVTELRRVEGN